MAKILIMNTKLKQILDVQRENRIISSAQLCIFSEGEVVAAPKVLELLPGFWSKV